MERQIQEVARVVTIDDLVEEVCWHLLAGSRVGRIGFVADEQPWILPVNFVMRGRAVVFRTSEGSMLHGLGDGATVAVEVDHVDHAARTGWSVLARGRAWEVNDPEQIATFADGAVEPWAPGVRDRWLWVVPHSISGRAISRHRLDARPPYVSSR
jgi:nitroimidazol reductase NimA-like FMN-containing flavoprotein (pyridoxamine 5'-phosphate oxidase superfamily)